MHHQFLLENNIILLLNSAIYQLENSELLDIIRYTIIYYYDKEESVELNKLVDNINYILSMNDGKSYS